MSQGWQIPVNEAVFFRFGFFFFFGFTIFRPELSEVENMYGMSGLRFRLSDILL